jgi:dolichol-phosphate mannosyltransferase
MDTPPLVSIVVPTKNEVANIPLLLKRLHCALQNIPAEVIFVDDSSDLTPQVVREESINFPLLSVRLIHRAENQRAGGLSSAVAMGMQAARAEWVCVMDGDLQHPPEVIPVMLRELTQRPVDLMIASRRATNSNASCLGSARTLVSKGLDMLARVIFPGRFRGVSDPLTGFFMLRLKAVKLEDLKLHGFKILLSILVQNPQLRKAEIPFHFNNRHAGQSKASTREVASYLSLLWALRLPNIPFQFIAFALVGVSGLVVNTLVMGLLTALLGMHYLISAAFATVSSTVWNFLLTELFIFNARASVAGRMRRFWLFFMMNNLALLFRAPIIYMLTAWLSVYYLVSNVASMGAVMVLRYFLSDRLIWGKPVLPASSGAVFSLPVPAFQLISKSAVTKREKMPATYFYNLYDILTVVSEVGLPELEPFKVEKVIDQPNILVRVARRQTGPLVEPGEAAPGKRFHYKEIFGRFGFEARVEFGKCITVDASALLSYSPHVLYTNVVEPILRWAFVERGYALVHGATIAFQDRAYIITARTDTGKTTTLLKILSQQRRKTDKLSFISDDMTLLSPQGYVFAYPKPLTISSHTVKAVDADVLTRTEKLALFFQSRIHSRAGRKAAFWLGRTHLPMATINALVQMLVPPPKYMIQRLIPQVKLSPPAKLAGMFVIERGAETRVRLSQEEALQILLTNCEDAYGFPPYHDIKEYLYCRNGDDLRQVEQAIIEQAMSGVSTQLIRNSNMAWWRWIPALIDSDLAGVFTRRPEYNKGILVVETL